MATVLICEPPAIRRTTSSPSKAASIRFSAQRNQSAARSLTNFQWVFEPNVGQSAPQVKFLARARDAVIFLTSRSLYVSWSRPAKVSHQYATSSDSLEIEFAGAQEAVPTGAMPLPGKTNYLLGRDIRQWRTNVPHYAAVAYRELYPGVDARVYGGAQGLEYDLTAAPGADLRRILLRFNGAEKLRVNQQGDLRIEAGAHQLVMRRPFVYQVLNGGRKRISGGYQLLAGGSVGFAIGTHRADLPLIVDPSISIAYTTFLGGAGAEQGNSVAVDSSGAVYVGGTTTLAFSEPSPAVSPTMLGTATGSSVLFAAKVDTTQSGSPSLVYLTFIGGTADSEGGMIAVDNSASPPNLAILGWTTSTDFPVTVTTPTPGSTLNGSSDLTISELNGAGNTFNYSQYYGGSGAETTQGTGALVANSTGGGIATDSVGDVFVTSDTNSTDLLTAIPPVTPGFQPIFGGGTTDGFLAEFQSGTGTLLYSTYFGAAAGVVGSTGVAVDASGNAYVAGFTSSSSAFPAKNSFAAGPGGNDDAFVMQINPNPVVGGLVYASTFGGSAADHALGITVDNASPSDAYITGFTQSPDFVAAASVSPPFQPNLKGTSNAFLAVISQSGGVPSLQYETYLGGTGTLGDSGQRVAIVSPTQVFVVGKTSSADFPGPCSLQAFSGTQDGFLSELNPTVGGAASLVGTTFLGGTATAEANAVAVDPSTGNAIVAGDTLSSDYPLAGNPQNGLQPICASCQSSPAQPDAFLTTVKVAPGGCVAFSASPVQFGQFADGTTSPAINVALTNDGNAQLNVTSVTVTGPNLTDFSQTNTCLATSPIAAGGTCDFSITFSPTTIGAETASLQVFDDGVGSPQTLTLSGTGTGTGVTLSASSLGFGSLAQGQTSPEQTATLTNTSGDNLTIAASIGGTNPADFQFGTSNNCPSTLSQGGSCTIGIQFAPNEPNPPASGLPLSAQDALTITDQANQSTQQLSVALSGTELPATPNVVFLPTSLAFSGQNVGGKTASQPITLTNNGSAALAISAIGISGTNPGDFSETNTCPISPATLAINASCTISVTFQPTVAGPRAANVSVTDNAASSPQMVPLSGTGTAAGVTLMPSGLTFAGQNVNTPASAPQNVTLQNTGTGPLTISSITITGANSGDFAQTNNCPASTATLNPGAACSIAVTFAPTATGARSASLSIADDAIPSPQLVSLGGTGTTPGVLFGPNLIQFAPLIVGAQAGTQSVHVSNPGTGPLVITNVGFVGANPGDFPAAGSCVGAGGSSVTVPANSSCDIAVGFLPTAVGARDATLSVTDNAAGSPQKNVQISGTGTDVQLGAVSGGSTSVTINAGETATFSLQASPASGFSGTLAMSFTNPIPNATSTISPQQLAVSGNQPVAFSVSVATTARTALAPFFRRLPSGHKRQFVIGLWLLVLALLALVKWKFRQRSLLRPALLVASILVISSCGGGSAPPSSNGTPPGTYTVTITGAISGVTRQVNLSVTVK